MMPLAFIQNIGFPELLVILFIALLFFGNRLPGLGRSLGKSVSEFKAGVREGEQADAAAEAKAAEKPAASAPVEKK